MACLPTLQGSQLISCGAPTAAPLGRPVGAKIIRADHIASYTANASASYLSVATVTLTKDAVVSDIETVNGALVVSIGLKGGEVCAQTYDPTIELSFFGSYGSPISSAAGLGGIRGGANYSCVIAVDHGNGVYRIYGLGSPLECLSMVGDTNGNGFLRVTYGVEDWQVGTSIYALTAAGYAALKTAVPGGGDTPSTGGGTVDPNPLG